MEHRNNLKPVMAFDGSKVTIYECVKDACTATGLTYHKIMAAIKKGTVAGGSVWDIPCEDALKRFIEEQDRLKQNSNGE